MRDAFIRRLTALAAHEGCAYLRLDKSSAVSALRAGEAFELGRGRVLRDGDAVALIGCGGIVGELLDAADVLSSKGVECRVVSHHTVSSIDEALIRNAAAQTKGILTVEEHSVVGGLGSAIAEFCLEANLRPRHFRRLGLRNEFASVVGGQAYLRKRYGMDSTAVVHAVQTMLESD